jgi:hypothetical protein
MSNQDQYLKLWQQKRSELQVDINLPADWTAMHSILDQQLPVANPGASNTNLNSGSANMVKQLSHVATFKLIYIAAALITAAAITYLVVNHRAAVKNKKPAKTETRRDSVSNSKADASLINKQATDSAANHNPLADGVVNGESAVSALSKTAIADKNNAVVASNAGNNNTSGKNNINVSGKVNVDKHITGKGNTNLSGNHSPAVNSAANKNNSLNKPGFGGNTNGPRLLASANNIKSGLALNNHRVNNPARRGRSNNNVKKLSGNNTINSGSSDGQTEEYHQSDLNKLDNKTPGAARQANIVQLQPSPINFNTDNELLTNNYTTAGMAATASATKTKNRIGKPLIVKAAKDKISAGSNLDWGILVGVSTRGSFTPKDQNKNIYGSLPVDAYTGLFATYNFNNKWAVDMQVKLLMPNSVSGSYNHVFATRNDTGQIVKQTYKITDTRKIYSAQMPLHLVYNITNNFSVKGGPVINLPIKHFGRSSLTALTDTVVDSIGYAGRLADTINRITLKKRIGVGISAGVGFNYKRLLLEAVYYHGSQPYKIISPVGSYSPAVNNIQISLGFKLNKPKPK